MSDDPRPPRRFRALKIVLAALGGAAMMAVASAAGFAGASTAANPPSVRSLPYVTGTAQVGRLLALVEEERAVGTISTREQALELVRRSVSRE